jgi:hypothetical protein
VQFRQLAFVWTLLCFVFVIGHLAIGDVLPSRIALSSDVAITTAIDRQTLLTTSDIMVAHATERSSGTAWELLQVRACVDFRTLPFFFLGTTH